MGSSTPMNLLSMTLERLTCEPNVFINVFVHASVSNLAVCIVLLVAVSLFVPLFKFDLSVFWLYVISV